MVIYYVINGELLRNPVNGTVSFQVHEELVRRSSMVMHHRQQSSETFIITKNLVTLQFLSFDSLSEFLNWVDSLPIDVIYDYKVIDLNNDETVRKYYNPVNVSEILTASQTSVELARNQRTSLERTMSAWGVTD